jgi:hypothetical protein
VGLVTSRARFTDGALQWIRPYHEEETGGPGVEDQKKAQTVVRNGHTEESKEVRR